jgi:transposase-like protein
MTSASSRSDRAAPAHDWAAIRQAYVDRKTSVRDICRLHGIHSQALYRRADKEGWRRRRESQSNAKQRQTLQLLARLRRIARSQIDEIEARCKATTDPASPGEPERDARALTALVKLIEHIAAIEAKHQVRRDGTRDGTGGGSEADRSRRRTELADKLIAMLEQERGTPLPEGDGG